MGWTPTQQRQVAVLDLSAGDVRVLDTTPGAYGGFEWRADGMGIAVIKQAVGDRTSKGPFAPKAKVGWGFRGSPRSWAVIAA